MFNKRKKGQRSSPRRGQSTVEYIVLVTAVLAVAIAFLVSPSGPFQTRLNSSMDLTTSQMTNMAERLSNGQPLTNENSPAAPFSTDPTLNRIP